MRYRDKINLDKRIRDCSKCRGMNIKGVTQAAPAYGSIDSPVMMIGQSLCTACMETQIPFTGGSGLILDEVFKRLGVRKKDLFITNLVHCHPVGNRPSKPSEIANCTPWLYREINIVNPLLIVGFGTDVRQAIQPYPPFNQMCKYINGWLEGRHVLCVYHPAYFWRKGGMHSKMTQEYIAYLTEQIGRFV